MIKFIDDEILSFVPWERGLLGLPATYCPISCIKIEKHLVTIDYVYFAQYNYGHFGYSSVVSIVEAEARLKDLEFVEV